MAKSYRIVEKHSNKGTCINSNKKGSGRRRTERTQENIDCLRQALENNPNISTKQISINLSLKSER